MEALGFRAQAAFVKLATPSVDPTIHFPLQRYDQLLGYCEAVANGLVDSKLLPVSTAAGEGSVAPAAVLQPLPPQSFLHAAIGNPHPRPPHPSPSLTLFPIAALQQSLPTQRPEEVATTGAELQLLLNSMSHLHDAMMYTAEVTRRFTHPTDLQFMHGILAIHCHVLASLQSRLNHLQFLNAADSTLRSVAFRRYLKRPLAPVGQTASIHPADQAFIKSVYDDFSK